MSMQDMAVRFGLFAADNARATEFYRDVPGFEVAAAFGDADACYLRTTSRESARYQR